MQMHGNKERGMIFHATQPFEEDDTGTLYKTYVTHGISQRKHSQLSTHIAC